MGTRARGLIERIGGVVVDSAMKTTTRRAIRGCAGLGVLAVMIAASVRADDKLPKFYRFGDAGMAEAFAEEEKADFSLLYNHDDRLDIGVGPASAGGGRTPVTFTFDELRDF
jgi:hypothetical protein